MLVKCLYCDSDNDATATGGLLAPEVTATVASSEDDSWPSEAVRRTT